MFPLSPVYAGILAEIVCEFNVARMQFFRKTIYCWWTEIAIGCLQLQPKMGQLRDRWLGTEKKLKKCLRGKEKKAIINWRESKVYITNYCFFAGMDDNRF